jgi:hypothetical protein
MNTYRLSPVRWPDNQVVTWLTVDWNNTEYGRVDVSVPRKGIWRGEQQIAIFKDYLGETQ